MFPDFYFDKPTLFCTQTYYCPICERWLSTTHYDKLGNKVSENHSDNFISMNKPCIFCEKTLKINN